MSTVGRKRTLGAAVSDLLLKLQNQRKDRLGRASGYCSSRVREKFCPVAKCVRVHWVASQPPSALHS